MIDYQCWRPFPHAVEETLRYDIGCQLAEERLLPRLREMAQVIATTAGSAQRRSTDPPAQSTDSAATHAPVPSKIGAATVSAGSGTVLA